MPPEPVRSVVARSVQPSPPGKTPAPARSPRPESRREGNGKSGVAYLPEAAFRGLDRFLDKFLGEYAAMFRSNKPLLLGLAGFLGAALGALAAEIVPHFHMEPERVGEGIYTGIYSGVAASFLTAALWLAGEYHMRRMELHWRALLKPFFSGTLAGAFAGGLAAFVYGSAHVVEYWREVLFRPVCWGAMGCLLGWRLSVGSPNSGASRGMAGGAIGGAVGGFAFLFTAILLPQFMGRVVGFGVMGAALGLALVAVDAMFRDATLEVVWARNETTSIPLGTRPVYIGGGDDHVSIPGLAEHAIALTLEEGRIRLFDKTSGRKTDLKDGSSVKIGKVELLIHAKSAAGKAASKANEER